MFFFFAYYYYRCCCSSSSSSSSSSFFFFLLLYSYCLLFPHLFFLFLFSSSYYYYFSFFISFMSFFPSFCLSFLLSFLPSFFFLPSQKIGQFACSCELVHRLANQAAWERGSKIGTSRKWLREGAEGLLDPGSEKPLAMVQNRVAPVQDRFRKVQETLGRPLLAGCERPFAPSRNHFREFAIFDPLSQAAWFAIIGLGVSQRPLTLILLQKYRDTNGSRIVMQIGGVYTTLCQKEGILLQKYRDRNGRCIAILFKCIGVRGRFDSPDRPHAMT